MGGEGEGDRDGAILKAFPFQPSPNVDVMWKLSLLLVLPSDGFPTKLIRPNSNLIWKVSRIDSSTDFCTGTRKSTSAAKQNASKLVQLPNLNVICCWKLTKIQLHKVGEFYRRCMVGEGGGWRGAEGKFVPPHPTIKTSLKLGDFVKHILIHLYP